MNKKLDLETDDDNKFDIEYNKSELIYSKDVRK